MSKLKALFMPGEIGSRISPDRFVAQPMETNNSIEKGRVSTEALKRYRELARGKWGIIIVEAISITPESLARKNGMILSHENLESFRALVNTMKEEAPDTLILFQITHSGVNSNPAFSKKKSICPLPEGNFEQFQSEEIEIIRDKFISAAQLSEMAGADGIDFKMCHGYFGAEMLRPANTREDGWGGSFKDRTRFMREVVNGIKEVCSSEFILGSRISAFEGIRGGFGTSGPEAVIEDLSEFRKLLSLMEELGYDYVNISAGIPTKTPGLTRPVKGSRLQYLNMMRYHKEAKDQLKHISSDIKVIGSAYSILKEEGVMLADENIQNSDADFIGWGRQNFADPLMPEKIRKGQMVNWCTACSGCTKLMKSQFKTGCIVYDENYKQLYKEHKKELI
jgi:2,4-dienoyl-CoA reductase-like NADH-dependent reductase (Old Yellow Enzyme family)